MPHVAALKEGICPPAGLPWRRRALALSARLLTIFRALAVAPFVWLMLSAAVPGDEPWRPALLALYLAVALSDFMDGRLARAAGTADARWARFDAAADITFNLASLATAAWLGLIGVWVPAGMALLAGRFLARNLPGSASQEDRVTEDTAGKLAGVIYYLLVGILAVDLASGAIGAWAVARAGDLTFLYTVFAWSRGRRSPKSSE
jgi:hypothetical protein